MRKCQWSRSAFSLAAVAGLAGAAFAAPPGNAKVDPVFHPIMPPVIVDDPAGLEIAAKLGLNRPMGGVNGLRGVPGCPDIVFDANCHAFEAAEGAFFSNAGAGNFRSIDNFTPVASNPDRLCWVGRYAGREGPAVANESFEIRIFADNGGLPDLSAGPIFSRVFSQSGTAGFDLLETDCLDNQACPGDPLAGTGGAWMASVQVTGGLPVTANGCYWLEIVNVGSAGAGRNWGWGGSLNGNDNVTLQAIDGQYNAYTRQARDRAFCLTGGLLGPGAFGCQTAPQPPICLAPDANGIPNNGPQTVGYRASSPGSVGRTAAPGAWTPFQRAENFQFASPTTVSEICFGGFWLGVTDAGATVGIAAPANPAFNITYWAALDGFPGAPLPAADFTVGNPGVTLIWDGQNVSRVTHPPVNFAADTCYFVSIGRVQSAQAVGAPVTPLWHWFLTTPSTPTGDDRIYSRAVGPVGAWGSFTIAPANPSNLWFLFDNGPTTTAECPLPPPPPPPANDLCINAVTLTQPCQGQPTSVNGTSVGALNDGMGACGGATAQTAGGVWYKVVGTGGSMTASTCSTPAPGYDGQISVFSGSCGGLLCEGGDDDGCGNVGGLSTVTWSSTSGTDYYIMVHGWGSDWGAFTLVVSTDTPCGPGGDCNENGIDDSVEIAGNPALDCYNPTVVQNPHVMGGSDGIIDACQCAANWNRDAQVNSTDLSTFITSWLAAVNSQTTGADINCSGTVNSTDLSAFITLWLSALNNTVPYDGCP